MLRALVLVLCASLLACSQQSVLPGAAAGGLGGAAEQDDGTVRLIDERGDTVLLRPDDTLRVTTVGEATTTLSGREVCRSGAGLARGKGGSCARAAWVAGWDEIASIEVEQFDGAATVAVTTAVAIIVVGVVLMTIGSKGGGGVTSVSSGGSKKPRSPAPRAPQVASAPRPGGHLVGVSVRTALPVDSATAALPPEPAAPEASGARPGAAAGEPLFRGSTVRRATVSPSLRLDLTGCVAGERCLAQSVRGGLLMGDLIELSGGARFEQIGTRTAWLGVLGLALQGRFTGAPWMAIALGSQVAVGGESLRVTPNAGLRFEPVRGTVLGLMPLALTYFQQEERVAYTPSLDLAYQY